MSQDFKTTIADKELVISTGKLAQLASGSVTVRYGDTVVLATAVVAAEARDDIDYFPLLVDYEERLYAAGKISGSRFIKREGRPSEQAILTCRLIDRPIRPLFPKAFKNDVQVVITVLSFDLENDPGIISIIAASAALCQSNAPFEGPVAASRVGLIDGEFVLNPTVKQLENSKLDLVVAGNKEKVLMLEAGSNEVDEKTMIEAIKFGHKGLQPALEIQKELISETKHTVEEAEEPAIIKEIKSYLGKKLAEIVYVTDKAKRQEQISAFEKEVLENFEGNYKQIELKSAFGQVLEKEVRQAVIDKEIRPDGRKIDEIRPISVEVDLLPRTHGSGLFTRGQTQVMSIITLGPPSEEQIIETMEEEGTKRYMHHYNFPPFSTGEVKPMRSTSRREIGHGALAERALLPVIPSREEFPYTIRVVSEVLASNGSSSMASTCGSTLALMDAGVPIKTPVAGIAMGLMTSEDGKKHKILTDIAGIEDFAGDMDFKITATKDGITAIQLDTKLKGLDFDVLQEALVAARKANDTILSKINAVISEPRKELSKYAPRIETVKIPIDKIGEIIGPGGKNIRKLIEDCGGKEVITIDIEDDGTVTVASIEPEASKKALTYIEGVTKEVELGKIYEGPVTTIVKDRMSGKEIGAIVQVLPNQDGMVHISQIADERVEKIEDVLKIGQVVKVKVMEIDKERGRVSLSIKAAKE
ncbi:TPA: polyribonucleotide nucleotidyltransferase [Candidatus Berkelbacteria bacterium]|uniref:Polyribonucleotide nucleotidyltransferase n=1 Tax=Berkelbacteria bacterium GW2011_GWE1_39_12 TaxID=1618337 RepID=A0A0G4B3A3_9BACT|nr:MAG: polyribonucleotide nucleotidyltransferase, polyribonucleotide nucleotidyltransferase [Berkelbacteria bacterium GW2011_GWE1_39_12]HBO60910.1 polyribonucleotide nucleotidyltransferase [Candidatus Berkelbacteria bacterium]